MVTPQISVIIPVYNRGALIEKTVQSVLAQDLSPENVEILIVDDGSVDETFSVLQGLYAHHPRVRLFWVPNGGVARARNFGLEQARGEFIAFCDHDDLWLPAKLRLQLAALQANPRANLAYCNWLSVDENNQAMPQPLQLTQQPWWRPAQGRIYPWILMPHPSQFLRNPIFSLSFPLIRADVLRAIGGCDPQMVPSDDWDLLVQLAQIGEFVYVPEVLVFYVHHANQQHMNLEPAYQSWVRLCLKHPVSARRHPLVWWKQRMFLRLSRALLCYYRAERALERGSWISFARALIGALWLRPDTLVYRRWRALLRRALRRGAR